MSKRTRTEERQRAKAAKQTKLVSALVLVFLGVMAFQFMGAAPDATPPSEPALAETAAAPQNAPATAAEAAAPADLPQVGLAEIIAADPFIKPEEAVALETPPQQPAPVEPRVEVPVRAVYGNSRGAVALIGRDVVAEGDRIQPSIEISRIAPGRVIVRHGASTPALEAGNR